MPIALLDPSVVGEIKVLKLIPPNMRPHFAKFQRIHYSTNLQHEFNGSLVGARLTHKGNENQAIQRSYPRSEPLSRKLH
jgi:hypothetical protein